MFLTRTTTKTIATYYAKQREVTEYQDSGNVRIGKDAGNVELFMKFVQLGSDKTKTTLSSTALVAYPVLVIPSHKSTKRKAPLPSSAHNQVEFLKVCYGDI